MEKKLRLTDAGLAMFRRAARPAPKRKGTTGVDVGSATPSSGRKKAAKKKRRRAQRESRRRNRR